ncbi:transcription termination factor 3, mitochondrial [Neodiprion fabricii]|uniref:transcription termination factor 3, mitochondrial n=1 Tax=Neodiprion fabricii TaxID=2872261 RepID=UPI001ED947F4|nr:transcription termination factor 3, mitochondrial [Neodiprion fabricii]
MFSCHSIAVLRRCGRHLTLNMKTLEVSLTIPTISQCSKFATDIVDQKKVIDYSLVNQLQASEAKSTDSVPKLDHRTVANYEYDDEILDVDLLMEKLKRDRPGPLDPCDSDLSHLGPYLPATFNFAAYANKSPMIQKLAELGVNFAKIEKRNGLMKFLLPLDFEKDMKYHIRFLNDCGVPADYLGEFLTKNPLIFKEHLDDLYTRIRYLSAHNFTPDMITRIVMKNPYWVMFSTKRIDARLGHFQKTFNLSGKEIRKLATRLPKLITYNMNHVNGNTFAVKEEMGFEDYQTKILLLNHPSIWTKNRSFVVEVFDYVHNIMKLSHDAITQQPLILTCRLHRIKQRHMFLKKLDRAQYDPEKPLYVPLRSIVLDSDSDFCMEFAKMPVETFNRFLKSL